jgi:hypothetical protein
MDGDDSTAELKAKIFSLTLACPLGKHRPECPFGRLAGLSYDCRRNMLQQMDDAAVLSLFDIAPCECLPDPRRDLQIMTGTVGLPLLPLLSPPT